MNDRERRRLDMFLRVRQFGVMNNGTLGTIAPAVANFTVIDQVIGALQSEGADQISGIGEARAAVEIKDDAREELREQMSDISRLARSMDYAFPGIADRFRMPRNTTDQTLLAAARSFIEEILTEKANFVAYGMPATFDTTLAAAADAFEATFPAVAMSTDVHVAATAEIASNVRRGMTARRVLDGIIRNVYKSDPGTLAAWLSASHVEKDPKTPKPIPIPPNP